MSNSLFLSRFLFVLWIRKFFRFIVNDFYVCPDRTFQAKHLTAIFKFELSCFFMACLYMYVQTTVYTKSFWAMSTFEITWAFMDCLYMPFQIILLGKLFKHSLHSKYLFPPLWIFKCFSSFLWYWKSWKIRHIQILLIFMYGVYTFVQITPFFEFSETIFAFKILNSPMNGFSWSFKELPCVNSLSHSLH